VKLATIEYKSALLVEENVQRQLRQEVEQAHLNMQNAWERYTVTLEQVAAFAESFRAAEVRFNAGVGNSIDYMLAKNNLDRANLSLIMTRYDFLLRRQILDYYVR
jgi:outer membrane protein